MIGITIIDDLVQGYKYREPLITRTASAIAENAKRRVDQNNLTPRIAVTMSSAFVAHVRFTWNHKHTACSFMASADAVISALLRSERRLLTNRAGVFTGFSSQRKRVFLS